MHWTDRASASSVCSDAGETCRILASSRSALSRACVAAASRSGGVAVCAISFRSRVISTRSDANSLSSLGEKCCFIILFDKQSEPSSRVHVGGSNVYRGEPAGDLFAGDAAGIILVGRDTRASIIALGLFLK